MDAIGQNVVRIGALELNEAKFDAWQALREEAEKLRERGEEVSVEIRKQIFILEGVPEDEAEYLAHFPEETPEPAQRTDKYAAAVPSFTWIGQTLSSAFSPGEWVAIAPASLDELLVKRHATYFPVSGKGSIGAIVGLEELPHVLIDTHGEVITKHLKSCLVNALRDVAETEIVHITSGSCHIRRHHGGKWTIKDGSSTSRRNVHPSGNVSSYIPNRLAELA